MSILQEGSTGQRILGKKQVFASLHSPPEEICLCALSHKLFPPSTKPSLYEALSAAEGKAEASSPATGHARFYLASSSGASKRGYPERGPALPGWSSPTASTGTCRQRLQRRWAGARARDSGATAASCQGLTATEQHPQEAALAQPALPPSVPRAGQTRLP